jgi:D-alanine-D-alanine ligase
MMKKLNLGVIFGGRSGEHDVSLMSARSVLSVLNPQKYIVYAIGITRQGAWLTAESPSLVLEALQKDSHEGTTRVTLLPETGQATLYAIHGEEDNQRLEALVDLDVIFPVLHGTFGEDGTIQGLFEMAGLAYAAAGVLGSAVGMDKALFKDVMRANGLPVVESIIVDRSQIEQDINAVIARAESLSAYPLFTKPANLGSSVGITKCRTRSDLYEGLMEAAAYDRRILVERGIANAREIEVSVLGNDRPQASIAGEIRPSGDFYTYDAKYIDERSELIIPAPLPEEISQHVRALAVQAYKAIDCAGMARVDFLLDPLSQRVYVGELNTIPGFTKISMYPKLWEASGIGYAALVDRLIELGLERKADRDHTEHQFKRSSSPRGGS